METQTRSQAEAIGACLRTLFSPEVRVRAARLRDCLDELSPAERRLVEGVARHRQLELATGRSLARQLLAELGHEDFELLPDAQRVPVWPRGVIGSISHKDDLCVVVVASERDRLGLGVDVEQDRPPRPGLERLVCRPSERAWLEAASPAERGRRCRAVFTAKEAVYKAFFPRLRAVWGFQDVELSIDLESGTFDAQLPAGADRSVVKGRILRHAGWILAGVEYA